MSKEGESLFGNISLGDGSIEILDSATEPLIDVDKPNEKEITVDDSKANDDSIEVPDKVGTKPVVDDTAEDTDTTDTQDKDDAPSKKQGNSSSSSSPFKPFAKALFEEGIISNFDEEEYDKLVEEYDGDEALALIELNKRTIDGEIESYIKDSEAEYKAFLEARDAGVNLNDWAQVQDSKKRFAKIDPEDSETFNDKLQKQLITEDLKKRGFSSEEVVDMIESFEDTNKLEIKAKKSLENLIKYEDTKEESLKTSAKEQEKQAAKDAKEQVATLKKQIESTDEIIPGLKLNKATKDEIMQSITQPVKTLEDGRQLNAVMVKRGEDPVKYAILEAYFVKQGFFDGKFDKLITKTKSKAVSELAASLNKDSSYKPGKTALKDGSGDDDYSEFEKSFSRIGKRN